MVSYSSSWRDFNFHDFYPFSDSVLIEQELVSNCKFNSVCNLNKLSMPSRCNQDLFVLNLNCCSLNNKFNSFCAFLTQLSRQPDIICLTESWLTANNNVLQIPGYNFYNFPRGSRGGGIALYVRSGFDAFIVGINFVPSSFEVGMLQLRVSGSNSFISFLGIYRPPSNSKDDFLDEFERLMQSVPHGVSDYIIVSGDFNIDLLDINQYSCGLLNLMLSFNLFPSIFKPTHAVTENASLIDNIFANFPTVLHSGVITEQFSKHLPVFALYKLPDPIIGIVRNINTSYKTVRYLTKSGIELSRQDLLQSDWSFITDTSCVDDDYNTFINIIINTFDRRLPLKYISTSETKTNTKSWITQGIRKSCKQKSKLYKKVIKGNYPMENYILYRNKLNQLIKRCKADYYLNIISNNVKNSKIAWDVVNELLGKNQRKLDMPIDLDCNKINAFFTSLGPNAINSLPPKVNYTVNVKNACKNSFVLLDTNADEVISVVRNLISKKSCGLDGISTVMLKHVIDIIASPLSKIINKSFNCGIVPSTLKRSRVIPIYKSGNKDDLINYRPISLLPVISKVFEKLVYIRMISFIDKNKILSNCQFGFRANHSTSHAIIRLTDLISSYLDKSEKVAGIFLDISKAFDSLDQDILLQKLDAYGFRGPIYHWLKSFIKNRFQCVVYNSVQSNFLSLSHGVAQGSTLGPLLFLLYINDLPDVSNNCDFILFADDTTVLFHDKNSNQLAIDINKELKLISEWFIVNRLALNLKKTCAVPFFVKKPLLLQPIYISNTLIPSVNYTKFLGIIIDSQLSWSLHVNFICNKLSQCVYMMRVCAANVPLHVRKQMYFAFAQSFINYGIECWGNTMNDNLNRILVLQKRIVRSMYFLHPLTHCAPYAAKANILFVNDLYYFHLCILAFKVFRKLPMPDNISLKFHRPITGHNTRAVNLNFVVLNSKLNIRRFSPVVNCIFIWNALSVECRSVSSLHMYKSQLKLNLFHTYD